MVVDRNHSLRKSGFTLVELLVVIAIIGVLVALLLPAIQAAREAARRIQCVNNLKQLGLALHNYHDAKGQLPQGSAYPGRTAGRQQVGPTTFVTANGYNWAVQTFPYLELQNLYDQFDFSLWVNQGVNADLALKIVEGFICPSDGNSGNALLEDRGDAGKAYNPKVSAGTWYVASIGPTKPDGGNPQCPNNANNDPSYCNLGCSFGTRAPNEHGLCKQPLEFGDSSVGMFSRYPVGYKFREVSDGLSNTWLVGETIPAHNIFNALYGLNFPLASTATPMNNFISDEGQYDPSLWPITSGFKSRHPGGANFLLGDGSVTFVSEAIDYRLYNELGTRAHGESVNVVSD